VVNNLEFVSRNLVKSVLTLFIRVFDDGCGELVRRHIGNIDRDEIERTLREMKIESDVLIVVDGEA
jgi:hypothetical protein